MTPTATDTFRKANYQRLLQTAEWREFADRIRAQRRYTCELCRLGGELNVHHHCYEPGRFPWEYEGHEVILLCRSCHEAMHEQLLNFRRNVFSRLDPPTFRVLNGALAVGLYARDRLNRLHLAYAIAELIANPRTVTAFASDWVLRTGTALGAQDQPQPQAARPAPSGVAGTLVP